MVKSSKNFKHGFSLIEALVVMTIVTIFIAVIANVIPHKPKPKLSAEAHGGFECYWKSDGKLYSRVITLGNENSEKEETGSDVNGKYCFFKPNHYVPYLIFNVVGGGARGSSTNGGGAGQFTSAFFPVPQVSYKLYPGKGGTNAHTSGYPSFVISGGERIVEVNGGSDTSTAENSNVSDIVDVYLAGHMPQNVVAYGCAYSPRVWLGADGFIHVSFCETSANIVEKKFEYNNPDYSTNKAKYEKTIVNSPVVNSNATDSNGVRAKVLSTLKSGTTNIWQYYDIGVFIDSGLDPLNLPTGCTYNKIMAMNDPMCPSRFKLEIKLNIPDNGAQGATSSLTKYAGLMQLDNLKAVKPGNGGAKGNGAGYSGGILVSW